MRFIRNRQNNDDPLSFTAMVDVVFLLLIFFICTCSLHLPESEIKAAVPGVAKNPPDIPPVRLILVSSGNGTQITCDGLVCDNDSTLLSEIVARSAIADIPVVFAIEDDVVFDDIVHVMDICRQGGLKRLALPVGF